VSPKFKPQNCQKKKKKKEKEKEKHQGEKCNEIYLLEF
jgi:hypothetical protein